MDREFEQVSADFTSKAQKLFTLTCERFRFSTKKLDRQRDENVFQMQVEKFQATLKQELENIAYELLIKSKTLTNIDECNSMLRNNINIYLREFRQKSRLL